MKKTALILLVMLLTTTAALANDIDQKWGIGATYGWMKMVGGDYDYSNIDQNGGLWLRHGLSSKWSFEAAFRYGFVRPGSPMAGQDAGLTFDSTHAFYTTTLHGTLGARYHFSPENSWSPYAGLHAGFIDWTVRDENGNDDVGTFPDGETVYGYATTGRANYLDGSGLTLGATLGMEYFFSDAFSMGLAARYSYLVDNDMDNIGMSAVWGADNVDANSGLLEMYLGLTFYFGGNKDKDGDGILNDDDACPEEAEDFDGYQDEDGCPELDNDRDGFNDDCDQCPDQPEDMDGFQDEDGCPDPDNDGDGVLDGMDQCADTPAGVSVNEKGCPLVTEIKSDIILEGLAFTSGKAELQPSSFESLDKVVESMLAFPEVTVEIQGHTDNTGSAALNRDLSKQRADSVQAYLIMKGVAAERMTTVGCGEDSPIATNASKEGRTLNRRVELVRTDSN